MGRHNNSGRVDVGRIVLTPCEFIFDPMTEERIPYRYMNRMPQEELVLEDFRVSHGDVAEAIEKLADRFEQDHPDTEYYIMLYRRHSVEPAGKSTIKTLITKYGVKLKRDFGNDDIC